MAAPNSRDKLVEEFLRFLEVERNVSARTLTVYRQALAAFRAQKDVRSWLKCSPDDFRDYLFELMKSGQARSYIRLQFSAFRTFYRFLVERKICARSVRQLQLPKAEKVAARPDRKTDRRLLDAPLRVPKRKGGTDLMPLRDARPRYTAGLRRRAPSLNVVDLDIYTESVRIRQGRKERVCPVGLPALEPCRATARPRMSVGPFHQ